MDDRNYVTRNELNQLDRRVSKIESRMERSETKIENIEATLDDIKGNTNKILWIIITAIIVALLRMIFKEGMM